MDAIIHENTGAVMTLFPVTDINICDGEGKTALHYAVQMKDGTYVGMLLERDINILIRDAEGNTALALACSFHYYSHLQLSTIFQLYRYGVAYGKHLNMI